MSELLDLAGRVVRRARELGAEEATAAVTRSSQTSLSRRDGRVEQATESTSRSLGFSVLVDGRYSSHGTSDLRPEALDAFIAQAVAATRFLEEDRDHALPDGALCGRASSAEALDLLDPAIYSRSPEDRARDAEALEMSVRGRAPESAISSAVQVADGRSLTAQVATNGFADEHEDAWFMKGGEMTLLDGARRPEAAAYFATRYLADLPPEAYIASETTERAEERIGSGPIASGEYPLILLNRSAGRILGLLAGPLSGSALHEGRSCLAGKLGQRIGSEKLTILDDPTIPRGLASRPWDGDGLRANPLSIVEGGVLRSYYISSYYGRKLGMAPTTGGRSNWVVPPGERSWESIARDLPKAIVVDGFLGGNSNAVTGDFSLGIRGLLYENGERTRSLSEMNISGNLLDLFGRLVAIGNDPYVHSSVRTPALIFESAQFSGT